jgi:hypothetical protein
LVNVSMQSSTLKSTTAMPMRVSFMI